MANALYDKGREKFLKGEISWDTHNIKIVLVDVDDYTVDIAADEFLSDIPVGARVATSANLAGKTTTAGVADANNLILSGVTGDECEALVIYRDTGVAATSPLIGYVDTVASGLPVVPMGTNVQIIWSNGPNKIFKL